MGSLSVWNGTSWQPADTVPLATGTQRLQAAAAPYNVVGDGTTDNRTGLLAAITAANPGTSTQYYYGTNGQRVVELPAGMIGFTGLVTIPAYVGLVGQGRTNTVLKALNASASIQFGDSLTGATGAHEYLGPRSGGFTIDGAGITTSAPLAFGYGNGTQFADLHVQNSAQDGVLFSAAQNCKVFGLEVRDCARDLVVFDMGAGGNDLYSPHLGRAGRRWIGFYQTATRPSGSNAYPYPKDNTVYDGLCEYVQKTVGGQSATEMVYHGAGLFNRLVNMQVVGWDATATLSLIKMVKDNGSYESAKFWLENILLGGTRPYSTALDIGDSCEVILAGQVFATDLATLYNLRGAGSTVTVAGSVTQDAGTITTYFQGNGVAFEHDNIWNHQRAVTKHRAGTATQRTDESWVASGTGYEANARFTQTADGGMNWGPGSAATDTNLYRAGTGLLGTDTKMYVGGTVRLLAKTNPATCTQGELNVGTDGKLYVCSATNTWTVAGSQS